MKFPWQQQETERQEIQLTAVLCVLEGSKSGKKLRNKQQKLVDLRGFPPRSAFGETSGINQKASRAALRHQEQISSRAVHWAHGECHLPDTASRLSMKSAPD